MDAKTIADKELEALRDAHPRYTIGLAPSGETVMIVHCRGKQTPFKNRERQDCLGCGESMELGWYERRG
jgi:hypothetical protein